MDADPNELNKQAREHAWNWFALHAAQRMQTFNFFLIATAFLIAAYASLLEKHRVAAVAVALVGAWLVIWFNRLDRRTRQLVSAAERPLALLQERLAEATKVSDLKIIYRIDQPSPGASLYAQVIDIIHWTLVTVFLLAAMYAV